MDLTTTYLGLRLPHPIMPGAGPMADDFDEVRRLEDAGAPAIVVRSLFEEQLPEERLPEDQIAGHRFEDGRGATAAPGDASARSHAELRLGPEEYLNHLQKLKASTGMPVIASLNGTTAGGWLEYASLIEQAGADGIELNVYQTATDPTENAETIEKRIVSMVRSVRGQVSIPIAVKLAPFFTALTHFCHRLEEAGADGVVLFNRYYEPDINLEGPDVVSRLTLSHPSELFLRLRWLAVLSGKIKPSLAASGGVHDGVGALKAVTCGAHVVQMVSALLTQGPDHIRTVREELEHYLEEHEYDSLEQARGSLSLADCPDPCAFTRANYMQLIGGRDRG